MLGDGFDMDKLIFLDIDGVLNCELMYENCTQQDLYEKYGYPYCDLSKEKINLLNVLIEDTGSKVVLSSTWRKSNPDKSIQPILEKMGFKGEVIGSTPVLGYKQDIEGSFRGVPRGCEIQSWIDANNFNGKYIILDDDSDMLYCQRENFFRVDSYCGLTPNLVYRATNFLNH